MEKKKLTDDELALDFIQNGQGEIDAESESNDSASLEENRLSARLESAKKIMNLIGKAKPLPPSSSPETLGDFPTKGNSQSIAEGLEPRISPSQIPTSIGRFEVESLIGKGGFGLVFLAHDPELSRKVALKVPTFASLVSEESQTRFRRESRAIASLSHPNIVPIFEIGNDGPISFITSEYISGVDLASWVQEHGPLPEMLAARTISTIAEAIQHAHSRKVVHRDLKPANILLEVPEEAASFNPDLIRVADFGLAKILEETDEEATREGSVIGTPAYAAPEQLSADSAMDVNAASDIYSSGAILYFLLTGKAPYHAEKLTEIIRLVQTTDPISPSKMNPNVRRDLSAICLKCLEKSPTDRYPNANELQLDLQRFIKGEPVVARPVPLPSKAWKWCRRNSTLASLIAIASLGVLGGLFSAIWSANNSQIAAAQSRLQYLDSKKVIDEFYVKVSQNPLFKSAAFNDQKQELLETAKQHYTAFLQENAGDEDLIIELIRTKVYLAETEQISDRFDAAREGFTVSLEMIDDAKNNQSNSSELKFLRAKCLSSIGQMDSSTGKYDPAKENLDESIEIFETLLPDRLGDDAFVLDTIQAYQAMVHYHRRLNEAANANEYSVKQQTLLETVRVNRPLNSIMKNHYAISLGDQALYSRNTGNMGRAIELINQSASISEQLLKEESNPVWFAETALTTYYRRGTLRIGLGKMELALADAKKSLELCNAMLLLNRSPELKSQRIGAKNLVGVAYYYSGKQEESFAIRSESLEETRILASDYPTRIEFQITLGTQLLNQCNSLTDKMRLDQAAEMIGELNELVQRLEAEGHRHPTMPAMKINVKTTDGRICQRQERYEAALTAFNQALELCESRLLEQPTNPRLNYLRQNIYDNRAYTLLSLGRFEEAVVDRRESSRLQKQAPEYEKLALSETLARAGEFEEAQSVLASVNHSAAVKELSAGSVEKRLAWIHAALAAELQKQVDMDPEIESLVSNMNEEIGLFEKHFINAFELGHFEENPAQVLGVGQNSHLKPLLERPAIKPLVDQLKNKKVVE